MVTLFLLSAKAPAGQGRRETSFSHGDRWKRLMSTYIVVMPSTGRRLEAEEHIGIAGAPLAVSQAMSAKVGEAARASQPAVPRACQALAVAVFAAADVVIFRFPIVSVPRRGRIEQGCKAGRKPGESDKCDGIPMDPLITAGRFQARPRQALAPALGLRQHPSPIPKGAEVCTPRALSSSHWPWS
jgi:hypothetical protein